MTRRLYLYPGLPMPGSTPTENCYVGELVRAFEAVPFRPDKPSSVLAKTRKGKGVSLWRTWPSSIMARSATMNLVELWLNWRRRKPYWLSGTCTNLETFATTLLELARQDSDLVVITSDSRGSAKLLGFLRQSRAGPDVEVGIETSPLAQGFRSSPAR